MLVKKKTYDTGGLVVGLNVASDFRYSFYFHPWKLSIMLYVVFKSKAKK